LRHATIFITLIQLRGVNKADLAGKRVKFNVLFALDHNL
jgi:hypothetical protein